MSAWRNGTRGQRGDLLLAVALCAAAEIEVVMGGITRVSFVSAAVCTLPLALRRRVPFAAAAGVFASPVIDHALGGTWADPLALSIAMLIAAYSVAAYASLPTAVVGGLLAYGGWALNAWWWASQDNVDLSVVAALLAAAW